jgi:anti-sigma B factor antagonist
MRISEQRQGAITVLKPDGALTVADADDFAAGVQRAMTANMGRVVLDLSAVPFIDSRGLEVLLDLTEAASRGGRALKLCGSNKTLREVLELTDLVSQFEHFDDTQSAARSFL